mmetsp:Transcript_2654/g.3747  ORF Transcript_2654/g.3747 Transcript_2654/m.3747 type:complete len:158 (-) Transcript_2654:395-868(-)
MANISINHETNSAPNPNPGRKTIPYPTAAASNLKRAKPPVNTAISTPPPPNSILFLKAGLPLMLFCVGASLVLKDGLEGKRKEADVAKGAVSKSERQARMEREKDDMMTKINKIRKTDFDNTKRIERPEEILERRKKERERRNKWYSRTWRFLTFQK